MNFPNKIKMFLWKLLSNALPVGSLPYRRLSKEGCCQWRGASESRMRLFFLCYFSQHIWRLSPLGIISSVFQLDSFLSARDKLRQDL
ncbi:conserved hypothetical protein [Ricinus communis]|uniref:Reverse transcriptase zinc-binding domain-containing protein n=1 Tax=Ricinus communis TaxID=3988 RepID=B9SQ71_RICCO|nr:conserved hypothetical protein [Ricinus communis]